jgi:cell division septation protein DedD
MRERTAPVTEQDASEYELVLGNKQLLSILFLVVLLFGVFFAMGYVMGRNSAPVDTADGRGDSDRGPLVPSTVRQSGRQELPEPVQIESATKVEEQQTSKEREQSESAPANAATAETTPGAPPLVTEPQPGQRFLQVSAVAKPEAELLVEVLTRKRFNALIAPGPNDRLFRVLVGPVKDEEESVQVRSDLEAAGFKPIPRQY